MSCTHARPQALTRAPTHPSPTSSGTRYVWAIRVFPSTRAHARLREFDPATAGDGFVGGVCFSLISRRGVQGVCVDECCSQARCSLPSNFDCSYAFSLGAVAGGLVNAGLTGYAAAVTGLHKPVSDWQVLRCSP